MLASIATRHVLASRVISRVSRAGILRSFAGTSDNITYSGGQATEGQGGFYGSGGARAILPTVVDSADRQALLAYASDVEKITSVMDELEKLETKLMEEGGEGARVTSKSIEIKASIKKLMTSPEVREALDRLEIQGEPVWGLSTAEREMIILAREKMNEC